MEFNEKLQVLRKDKNLTQEELSQALYVSRTAISKWESGRGYPSIDSLKAISDFFYITIDDLLSSKELLTIAQKDKTKNTQGIKDLVFGLIDLSFLILLFIPLFGQHDGNYIRQVPLISAIEMLIYIKIISYLVILFPAIFGLLMLIFRYSESILWNRSKKIISLGINAVAIIVFIATLEPYVATYCFMMLIIKGILLLKRK